MSNEDRKLAWATFLVLVVIALELACFLLVGPPQTGANQQTNQEAYYWIRETIGSSAFWTAIFTCLLFVATYRLWNSTNRLAEGTEEAAKEQLRPWIEIAKPRIVNRFAPGRTQLGVDGFYLELSVVLINRGSVPATHVHFDAEIYLFGIGKQGPEERLRAFSSDWRGKHIQPGDAIFRNAEMPSGHMLFLPQPDISAALAAFPHDAKMKIISPYVIACVSYQSGQTKGPRQTGLCFPIVRVDQSGNTYVIDPTKDKWWEQPIAMAQPGITVAD